MALTLADVQQVYDGAVAAFAPSSSMAEGSKLWKQESHLAGIAAVAAAAWQEGQEAMARAMLSRSDENGMKRSEPNPFTGLHL